MHFSPCRGAAFAPCEVRVEGDTEAKQQISLASILLPSASSDDVCLPEMLRVRIQINYLNVKVLNFM